jgi:hypothetical protein
MTLAVQELGDRAGKDLAVLRALIHKEGCQPAGNVHRLLRILEMQATRNVSPLTIGRSRSSIFCVTGGGT